MSIFQKKGLHVHQPILSTTGAVTQEGERNTLHWTDEHTTRQRIIHPIKTWQ